MKKVFVCSLAALVMAMGFTSCKKDNDDDNQGTQPKAFKVRMTDGPGDFAQLNMQVTNVEAYHEGSGWINLNSQTQSMNVLSLTNGNEIVLANKTDVNTGVYSKLRITFSSSATIQLVGGSSALSLNWTGSSQQVEINIDEQVSSSAGANLLVDFNVAESVSETAGVFNINPVITVIEDESTGINGQVQGSSNVMVKLENNAHTYTTYTTSQGQFLIRGVESGTYTAYFWASGSAQAHEVDNVTVVNGQITGMGTIQL